MTKLIDKHYKAISNRKTLAESILIFYSHFSKNQLYA